MPRAGLVRRTLITAAAAATACFSAVGTPLVTPDAAAPSRDAAIFRDAGDAALVAIDGIDAGAPDSQALLDAAVGPDAAVVDASVDAGRWTAYEWCEAFVELEYQRAAECMGGTVESERHALHLEPICVGVQRANAAGTGGFRADLADACMAYVRGSTCDAWIDQGGGCAEQVLAGNVGLGSRCVSLLDCAWGLSCSATTPCEEGTCVAGPGYVACTGDDDCKAGEACAHGVCGGAPEGHTCGGTLGCENSCFCNAAGVCEHSKASGACQRAECDEDEGHEPGHQCEPGRDLEVVH